MTILFHSYMNPYSALTIINFMLIFPNIPLHWSANELRGH